jgi:Alw26I/Eco31I/Esp3I family type II restriction m6 adenine DNA methyltransferase
MVLTDISEIYYREVFAKNSGRKTALVRMLGQYFTPSLIANRLCRELVMALQEKQINQLRIIDPFCGDGKLAATLLSELSKYNRELLSDKCEITLWDIDGSCVKNAVSTVREEMSRIGMKAPVVAEPNDTFIQALRCRGAYDICITNPPWIGIKPNNSRVFESHEDFSSFAGVTSDYVSLLGNSYPNATQKSGFGKWNINLSKCGLEASLNLLSEQGICGIVLPSALFADHSSRALRAWVFESYRPTALHYYPAEAKLFPGVDQACVGAVIARQEKRTNRVILVNNDRKGNARETEIIGDDYEYLSKRDYAIPFGYDSTMLSILRKTNKLPKLGDVSSLVLGRELDETRIEDRLTTASSIRFAKGNMVGFYSFDDESPRYLNPDCISIPKSFQKPRIVWRDISRGSQKKRVQATLLPANYITGNSLGIGYSNCDDDITGLLGIVNSFTFEFFIRSVLATNHVSAGSMKKVPIPTTTLAEMSHLSPLVQYAIDSKGTNPSVVAKIDTLVGHMYGLTENEYRSIIDSFSIDDDLRQNISKEAKLVW